MSQLLPDVSLDEEDSRDEEDAADDASDQAPDEPDEEEPASKKSSEEPASSSAASSVETKSDSSTDTQNYSAKGGGGTGEAEADDLGLAVQPGSRPELNHKLGPYVSDEVDDALEEVYLLLRRRFGRGASKSLIVEAALRYALSDCLKREGDSELAHWLTAVLEEDS
jgi:hypothetical protein